MAQKGTGESPKKWIGDSRLSLAQASWGYPCFSKESLIFLLIKKILCE
jgi:hypothetical protein